MRAQAANPPNGVNCLEGLCIGSTKHMQATNQVPVDNKYTYQASLAKQHSPSEQQQRGFQQPESFQESQPVHTCTLEAGGRLSSALVLPAAAVSSKSSCMLGQSVTTMKHEQQLHMAVQLQNAQQQQQRLSNNKVLASAASTSQSCSVPTDLEVMDQLFDELVMLDPKLFHALADAPTVHFETFAVAQGTCSNTSGQQANDVDLHQTFLTACEVQDSQQQQDYNECDSSRSCIQPPKLPAATSQQQASLRSQPEVACSADLFTWKSRSQSGAGPDGRARLHSMSLDTTIEQQTASSSGGVTWADGGCSSHDGGAPDHTTGRCRLHRFSATEFPRLSLPLNKMPKLQDPVAFELLLTSQHQQQIPSLNDLKQQMNDVRKLHLSCVTDVSPVLVKSRAQQQQQQQLVGTVNGPQESDSRARTPRKTGESLSTNRRSPTTPKGQPQLSARQQQAAWQGLPLLQTSKEQKPGQAARRSSIGMRASAPTWKRK